MRCGTICADLGCRLEAPALYRPARTWCFSRSKSRGRKALPRVRFPGLAITDSIDTVQRFQGGERDMIIVSATASDPDYVLAEADFLLNLNRLNAALSRPRKKLVVAASRSVIELLPSDMDMFENAVIWKRLYHQCAAEVLWEGRRHGVPVCVRGAAANGR